MTMLMIPIRIGKQIIYIIYIFYCEQYIMHFHIHICYDVCVCKLYIRIYQMKSLSIARNNLDLSDSFFFLICNVMFK